MFDVLAARRVSLRRLRHHVGLMCLVWFAGLSTALSAETNTHIDFNREVRPILSDACFHCHGPEAAQRKKNKTKLRLDTRDGLFGNLDGIIPVVPGQPQKSELIARLISHDEDNVMPPRDAPKQLTKENIATITKWIEQGAKWEQHWAFVAPKAPALPKVNQEQWVKQPLDHFVLARLEQEKLIPNKETNRFTFIRRVSLDLHGLPPTPAEVDAFVQDKLPDAYERLVDRLLASPRYGEMMAMNWLDGARFADSHGYQADTQRHMWRWRDWVIDAFNNNMPFDQFTIEQLAGDLLPNATLEQKIATGFNRNHRINTEGGIIPEEWRIENVMDRVETTGQVWLGLTLGCARCHDHKYDPITQKEFYQFFAFFNTIDEVVRGGRRGSDTDNREPFVQAPTAVQLAKLAELTATVQNAEKQFKELEKDFLAQEKELEKKIPSALAALGDDIKTGLVAHYPLNNHAKDLQGAWADGIWKDGEASFTDKNVILAGAANFDSKAYIEVNVPKDTHAVEAKKPFTISAWILRSGGGVMPLISRLTTTDIQPQGYEIALRDGRVSLRFVGTKVTDKKESNELHVSCKDALAENVWNHVVITNDGSGKAAGIKIIANRQAQRTKIEKDSFSGYINTNIPLQLGAAIQKDTTQFQLADVRFYERALDDAAIARIRQQPLFDITQLPENKRTSEQNKELQDFLSRTFYPKLGEAKDKLLAAKQELKVFDDNLPTVMVMHEMDKPRVTNILTRGLYDHPTDVVEVGTPAAFLPMPTNAPRNRLGLAQWITDSANPLTARVAVNRMWERFFGIGLVKTTENLGSQAEPPSHPELLDFLATEFVRMRWDMKAFQRMIALSATYRQSSDTTPAMANNDPENRLLSHGPRFRLQAEVLRDQALAIAGYLHEEIGGPSVYPYQPDGIWNEMNDYGNLLNYKHDSDHNRYRRSLYTIWKRTTPPPTMTVFDMASREYCVVRRSRTNTPLQALTLLNDITYVEAARVLAERMISDGGKTASERITYGYRRALARVPTKEELTILSNGLEKRVAQFKNDTDSAKKLLAQGDTKPNPQLDPAELAAYSITASTILNLDETMTKE